MAEISPRSCSVPPCAQVQPSLAHAAGRGATQTILAQQRLIGTRSEPAERRAAAEAPRELLGLRAQLCIIGIQHQQAAAADDRRDRELHVGESGEVIDAVFAEMIRAHIGDDRGVGARYRDPAAQNAAARGFEDGRLRAPLAQHHPRARRPRIIARSPALHRRRIPRPCSCSRRASRGPARRRRAAAPWWSCRSSR